MVPSRLEEIRWSLNIMPSARRGEGLGYYGLANNFAMCLGPMIGLFLYDGGASFDTIFSIALGSCLLGFLSALCVRAPRKKSASKKKRPYFIRSICVA